MNDADRHFYSSSNCEMCPVCGAKVKNRMKSKIYNSGYREFPRKPRPLAARMNWKNKFKIT